MGLTGNKGDKTIPQSETPGLRSRPFLITAIALLATLICSSVCVMTLLLTMPEQKKAASQNGPTTSTPIARRTATHPSPAPSATKVSASATPSSAPAPAPTRGKHRIIAYDKRSAGGQRIIVYGEKADGGERIIVYQARASAIGATTTATPPGSIRIIDYADEN